MHVCLVSQEYPPETARGGVGTQTWNKARALAGLGHTVHVVSCSAGPGPDLRSQIDGGVTVHRMRPPGVDFPVYQTPTYWLGYSWAVLAQLHRLMEAVRFDVIDFPEYGAEGFAYQLDRTLWNWAPVVVQLHAPLAMFVEHIGWPEAGSDFHRVGTLMEEISIQRADALMACSANIANLTARYHGVPREAIDVVHCGVDAEVFRPGEGAWDDRRPTVLFVGNVVPNKGVEVLFEAVFRLRPRHPTIRLQIVGGGSALHDAFWQRIQREGAQGNFQFTGFVDRAGLPRYYQEADVFCSPAQYEGGVANVYIEAMACGCPVVASTAGGAPEAVSDGQTGLLVPPNDVPAVADALDRLLSDAPLRRRMGRAGRRRVDEYFAMDRYIQRVLAVYEKAITRSRQTLERLRAERGMASEESS
jgi:glycosyltransferase involved in cell wall biosynthesis